jgi:hypothetical protein
MNAAHHVTSLSYERSTHPVENHEDSSNSFASGLITACGIQCLVILVGMIGSLFYSIVSFFWHGPSSIYCFIVLAGTLLWGLLKLPTLPSEESLLEHCSGRLAGEGQERLRMILARG